MSHSILTGEGQEETRKQWQALGDVIAAFLEHPDAPEFAEARNKFVQHLEASEPGSSLLEQARSYLSK